MLFLTGQKLPHGLRPWFEQNLYTLRSIAIVPLSQSSVDRQRIIAWSRFNRSMRSTESPRRLNTPPSQSTTTWQTQRSRSGWFNPLGAEPSTATRPILHSDIDWQHQRNNAARTRRDAGHRRSTSYKGICSDRIDAPQGRILQVVPSLRLVRPVQTAARWIHPTPKPRADGVPSAVWTCIIITGIQQIECNSFR